MEIVHPERYLKDQRYILIQTALSIVKTLNRTIHKNSLSLRSFENLIVKHESFRRSYIRYEREFLEYAQLAFREQAYVKSNEIRSEFELFEQKHRSMRMSSLLQYIFNTGMFDSPSTVDDYYDWFFRLDLDEEPHLLIQDFKKCRDFYKDQIKSLKQTGSPALISFRRLKPERLLILPFNLPKGLYTITPERLVQARIHAVKESVYRGRPLQVYTTYSNGERTQLYPLTREYTEIEEFTWYILRLNRKIAFEFLNQ